MNHSSAAAADCPKHPLQSRGANSLGLGEEELLELLHSVFGAGDGVPDRPAVLEDLVVITALKCLVAEKVDLVKALGFDVAKRVGLVPAYGISLHRACIECTGRVTVFFVE